jgi:type IV secretion system protein VirB8
MNEMSALPVPPEMASRFFEQVDSLQADHVRASRRSRVAAWWIAGSAVAIAVLEGAAILALAPLHTVEWRPVRVDSATGVIDEVTQLREAPKTVNEANTRYTLAEYVRLREGYASPEAAYNFRAVSLMSTPTEQGRYAEGVKGSNSDSPQVQFGKVGFIRIETESVSVLGNGLGQVHFRREEQKDGAAKKITRWVATIGFEWKPDALISNADRIVNPLGFVVGDYHVDSVTQ